MAVVNFYDDILDELSSSVMVSGGVNLKQVVEDYITAKGDETKVVEVYNSETDTTEYRTINIESYKILAMCNGEETSLDYDVKEQDVIALFFIPQGDGKTWAIIGGVALAATGIGLAFASFSAGLAAATLTSKAVGLGIGALLSMGVAGHLLYIGLKNDDKEKSSDKEKEDLLSVDGAQNELILDKRYQLVMGKHLLYPYIVGSPYHETHVRNIKDANEGDLGQQFHVMYCAGYGPLRLTNFKIENTVLAYNQSSDYGDRKTILHGQLSGCDDADTGTVGDITNIWKNNDVKLEILQAGSKITDENVMDKQIYGNIYPQSVSEKKIKANILYLYDKLLEDNAREYRIYKGAEIPKGYRTNTVRFSDGCPQKIQVELNMPNGYMAVWQENGKTRYKKVPLHIAVQWRFARMDEEPSDANNPQGWHTFDEMVFDEGPVYPKPYRAADRISEISANKGLTPGTDTDYNNKWIGTPVFSIREEEDTNAWSYMTAEQITNALLSGELSSARFDYTQKYEEVTSFSYPYAARGERPATYDVYTVNPGYENEYKVENKSSGTGEYHYITSRPMVKIYADDEKVYTGNDDYNVNERRYVFQKTFTEEECRQMVNFHTDATYLDNIEVRVIRLTPCYLEETSAPSDSVTATAYQDLINWTYLRTYKFDKTKYIDALNAAEKEFGNADSVSVMDYLERFATIKDLDKFCYIGLQLKQDVSNTGGSSLKKLNVIAESFNPKYSETEQKWFPENISKTYSYFHKITNGDETKIVECSKEEYEENIAIKPLEYSKRCNGNDFVAQIRDEIFIADNIEKDEGGNIIVDPLIKYTIPETVVRKYISSNSASVTLLSLFGNHLGSESKVYDNVEMGVFADFYDFCNDVTDGTKQTYAGIPFQIKNNFDPTNPARYKTRDEFVTAGWSDFSGDYGTQEAETFVDSDETPSLAVVVAKVRNNGYILTPAEFEAQRTHFENGEPFDYDDIEMYRAAGSNCIMECERYSWVAHHIADIHFINQVTELVLKGRNILESLKDVPINALRDNIGEDLIQSLILLMNDLSAEEGTNNSYSFNGYYQPVLMYLEQTLNKGSTKYCKESDNLKHYRFRANGVLTKEIKMEQLLPKLLATGRANLKRSDDNKYEPLIGRPNPYPVTVLNQRNCHSRSNTKILDELPSGFQASLTDEDDNYGTNDFYVMDKGERPEDPTKKIEQFNMEYVTSKDQLACLTKYNLACRLYQRETYNASVGMIGYSLSLGDTLLIQDDTLLVGTDSGARIQEVIEDDSMIYGFVTDEPFEYTGVLDDKGLSVQGVTIVQPSKYQASRCVTLRVARESAHIEVNEKIYSMKKGLTNLILLENPINKSTETSAESVQDGILSQFRPQYDNLVVYGEIGKMYIKAIVASITPKAKDKFDLVAIPYNEDLFHAGFKTPVFKSNMTLPTMAESFEFRPYVTASELAEKTSESIGGVYTSDVKPIDVPTLECYAYKDYIELRPIMPETSSLPETVNGFVYEREIPVIHIVYKKDDDYYEDELFTIPAVIPQGVEPVLEEGNKYSYVTKSFEPVEIVNDTYIFDRTVDGYPEAATLSEWKFRVKAINIYGNESENWAVANVNTVGYGTWKIPNFTKEDNVSVDVLDRNVIIKCYPASTSRSLYGDLKYKISIKRIGFTKARESDLDSEYALKESVTLDDIIDTEWYAPDLYGTFLVDEDAYKGEVGEGIYGNIFSQTLPLLGQKGKDSPYSERILNTVYQYQITPFTEAGEGTPAVVTVTALCTSLSDIVKANMNYQDLYVKRLSAICANIGLISQGGMGEFGKSNYWALSTLLPEDTGLEDIIYKGAFQVGNDEQHIKVTPKLDPITQSLDYEVEIKAGNITLTTSGTSLDNGTEITSANNKFQRLVLKENGFVIQKRDFENTEWYDQGKIVIDQNGTLTLTNNTDESELPQAGVEIVSAIYHFNKPGNFTDEEGKNPLELIASGVVKSDGAKSYLSGDVSFDIPNKTFDLMFESEADGISVGESKIRTDGEVILGYNRMIDENWGFETIPTNLFKVNP